MSTTLLARRYSAAMLAAAGDSSEKVIEQLRGLSELFARSNEFRQLLISPVLAETAKEKALELVRGRLELLPAVANLLILLVRNRRGSLLPHLLPELERQNDGRLGRAHLQITTARSWSEPQKKSFLASLGMVNARVDWSEEAGLIGGVRVRKDDLVWDGSIRYQLDRIQHILTR